MKRDVEQMNLRTLMKNPWICDITRSATRGENKENEEEVG